MFQYRDEETSNDFDVTICILLLTVIVTEVLFGINGANQVNLALIYILGVFFISYLTLGYHFGLASAITLSFLYHYYRHTEQSQADIKDMVQLGVMLFTSVIISVIVSRTRSKARTASQRADWSDLIYEINQKLLTAPDLAAIVDCALLYAQQQLGHDMVFYTVDPTVGEAGLFSEGANELKTEEQRTNARQYFLNPDIGPTPYSNSAEFYYYPVRTNNDIVILMGVYFEYSSISKNDVIFIRDLMWHVGIAAELNSIMHMENIAHIESEREKTKNTLLRSVSHDLRTPLTGILGESTLIADHVHNLKPEEIKMYAEDIKENSQWLIRMVENLLMVTKLAGDGVAIDKTHGDVEEIMAQAVFIVRKRYNDANISVDGAANPVYVPMDATLMTQVLINILDNSVKYSPKGSPVNLKLEKGARHVCLTVSDKGVGIPEDLLNDILRDKLTKIKIADSKKGFRLGLTICKTIVKAHGGTLMIGRNKYGGTIVSVILPLNK